MSMREDGHVVSTRFDSSFLAEVRAQAAKDGQTVSAWLRDAAWRKAHGQYDRVPQAARPAGWTCQHMTITSIPGTLGPVTAGCGCKMRPYYPMTVNSAAA
jgi:hypothetical protein